MSYKVVLQGQEKLTISDEQAEKLIEVWKNKSVSTITIGRDTIAVSSIKGIFEIAKADMTNQNESWKRQNNEWDQTCLSMSKLSPEEKTEKELAIRILPAIKLASGKIPERSSDVIVKLWNELMDFFAGNPQVPRCPMKVWYPIVKPELNGKPFLTKFLEYVSRNDNEIAKWCHFNRIKVTFDYQKAMSDV